VGYGFDKIDDNWKTYNNSTPEYLIDFDSVIVKLTTQVGEALVGGSEAINTTMAQIHKGFGEISERLSMSSEKNLEFLRGNYGAITGYLRDKYGVNEEILNPEKNERATYILFMMDLFPYVTKEQMATILNCSLSTIEKTLQNLKKQVNIGRKGSAKTGSWVINKTE
jgi:predicted HTH transcriptional regulator